jgi:hypothetical protein
MDDALMTMFWAGLGLGICVGMGILGLIAAIWWFWPQRDELPDEDIEPDEIGPDDEFRVVADYPDHVPVEWGE